MSKDVSAFLVWAAEPKADNRKNAGIPVLLFLLIASLLGYLAYREIWRTAKRKVRITGPLEPESQAKAAAARADAGIEG
jgi:ubiquinol-cytochrome c reductase cytochrome c1 subunit